MRRSNATQRALLKFLQVSLDPDSFVEQLKCTDVVSKKVYGFHRIQGLQFSIIQWLIDFECSSIVYLNMDTSFVDICALKSKYYSLKFKCAPTSNPNPLPFGLSEFLKHIEIKAKFKEAMTKWHDG